MLCSFAVVLTRVVCLCVADQVWELRIANDQSVIARRPQASNVEHEVSGVEELPSGVGDVYACLYADAEETELGASEGGACAPEERNGSDGVHPRSWA